MSVSTARRPITFNYRADDTIDETIVLAVPAALYEQRRG